MTRQTRLAALALLGVLVSAGGVGSQDPYRARSEAQSAASATPVTAPVTSSEPASSTKSSDPYRAPSAQSAPQSIAPATPAVVMSPIVPDAPGRHQTADVTPAGGVPASAKVHVAQPMFVPITQ